jgi:drug/metabolite transporter (DMT)-like permease
VANSAIINSFNPAVTALMAALFINERLNWKNYIGLVVAMAGVLLLVTGGNVANLLDLNFNFGDLLMLVAVFSWVIYSLIVKTMALKYTGLVITFYAALFGVGQLCLLVISENFTEQVAHISATAVWALLYMGVIASGLGYLLYNLSIASIGPTRTSSFTYSLVPAFVAVLAFLFFGEMITIPMIFSTVPIIAGLYLLAIGRRPRDRNNC